MKREMTGDTGCERRNTTSGFTLVEIMIVVAIIGLLAAMALPSFSRARNTAQQNACINNLRQIDSAKEQWSLAASKSDGDDPVTTAVDGYIKGSTSPKCPGGGSYSYNVIGTNPSCSVSVPTSHRLAR